MAQFFKWMTENTDTLFWHDSGETAEIVEGIARGAIGVTCNPAIARRRLTTTPEEWTPRVRAMKEQFPDLDLSAQALKAMNMTCQAVAQEVRYLYDESAGKQGYVVGQVNTTQMDEAEPMVEQAIEATSLEPNLGVKIPATEAGMVAVEEMGARGQVCLSTVSFSTAQAIAAHDAYERGRKRGGVTDENVYHFSVMIIGRLDEYLHAKAKSENINIDPSDIDLAGLAVTKNINRIFAERGYRGMCLTGGTRARHIPALAGSRMCMTIGVAAQDDILELDPEQRALGLEPVPEDVIERLRAAFPEFSQALDEDGLQPSEFTSYGPCREMHDWFIKEFEGIQEFVAKA